MERELKTMRDRVIAVECRVKWIGITAKQLWQAAGISSNTWHAWKNNIYYARIDEWDRVLAIVDATEKANQPD